jgi:hypothetical protein
MANKITVKDDVVILVRGGKEYNFKSYALAFSDETYSNVFKEKKIKLRLVLEHKEYKNIVKKVNAEYKKYLDTPVGEFLAELKKQGNMFYQKFLKLHGDEEYSTFKITDTSILDKKGLYLYYCGTKLKYIGRCLNSFKKRINQGYGKISPTNCYLYGQSTNCHINSLVTKNKRQIKLYILPLTNKAEITSLEKCLIDEEKPDWNDLKSTISP